MEDAVRFIETPDAETDLGGVIGRFLSFCTLRLFVVGELVGINIADVGLSRSGWCASRASERSSGSCRWEPSSQAVMLYIRGTRETFC